MKKYQRLKESTEQEIESFLQDLEKTVKSIFPKSYVKTTFDKGMGQSIYLTFALGKDKSEWANGYYENDIVGIKFHAWQNPGKEFDLDRMVWESGGTSYIIKPQEKYRAYSSIKVPYRKITGDSKKVIVGMKKFFTNLDKSLKDNYDLLPDDLKQMVSHFK